MMHRCGRRAFLIGAALIFALTACGSQKYEKIETTAADETEEQVSEASLDGHDTSVVALSTDDQGTSDVIIVGEGQAQNLSSARVETHAPGEDDTASAGEHAEEESSEQPAPAAEIAWNECSDVWYVNTDSLNIRSQPSLDSEVVDIVGYGTELGCTGQDPDGVWVRIDHNGNTCYVAAEYLTAEKPEVPQNEDIKLNPDWRYAEFSKINSGTAKLYRADGSARNGITVCVNAGHGTSGGESVRTLCHPDGSAKVTGGSTAEGSTTATAVSYGTTFTDGTPEHQVTLQLALALKDKLLARGYDVLMIREGEDVQLDNIARTVIANNRADCHLALHWDSTESNKGAFYCSVPSNSSYRAMEPVASHWQEHNALGSSLINGLSGQGVKIFSNGSMEMDLTQTSYSTVPSVDIELGDRVSDHSAGTLDQLATGLADGVDIFFGR